MRAFILFFSVGSAACGGRIAEAVAVHEDDASVDASAARDAAPDVDSRDPLVCPGKPPIPFDKSCGSGGACRIAMVNVGCCVTDALGVSPADLSRLMKASETCAQLDPCDCTGNKVVADDGRASKDPARRDVVVTCDDGVCKTRIQ